MILILEGSDHVRHCSDPTQYLADRQLHADLLIRPSITAAEQFVVVAEASKKVARLGETRGLPVEVVRFAWRDTRRRLLELVSGAELRMDERGDVVVTDEGHYILDAELPAEGDLAALGEAIKAEVGVVEHGLFIGMSSLALLGNDDGSVERVSPR